MMVQSRDTANSAYKSWFLTFPTTIVLFLVIFLGTGEDLHSRLLHVGNQIWSGYFQLREDLEKPDCDPNPDLESRVKKKVQEQKKKREQEGGLGLIESGPVDRESIRKSLLRRRRNCREKWSRYRKQKKHMTMLVQAYWSVEKGVGNLQKMSFTYTRHLLVFLILLTAITATVTRHHVVLRPSKTVMDHWFSSVVKLMANSILLTSVLSYTYSHYVRKNGFEQPGLHALWVGGVTILTLISLYQLWAGIPDDARSRGNPLQAMASIPLYAYICLAGAVWFFLVEGYISGMTTQLRKMERFSSLFLKVGLYVWTGMLLKWTRLTSLVLDILRPWKFPPESVVIIFVMLCAFPTAYSGASGIFIIAAGTVIYEKLRELGARRQLSIATTAMSGSGVFLEPCLIIVIIAAINKEVTSARLFQYGFYVYLLMGLVVTVLLLLTRRNEFTCESPRKALKPSLKALLPIGPYLIAGGAVILSFYYVLNVPFDEYSAPNILPFMMILIVCYDQWSYGEIQSGKEVTQTDRTSGDHWKDRGFFRVLKSIQRTVRRATGEATEHIGALLTLMATTMILSGIVRRSQVMTTVPEEFTSTWIAMAFLVVVLVLVGMVMDPYGAVILISATFAPVAYQNGIDPVHFWLVVLVAFELGYLTPPVALNQQFTRLVIGEKEYEKGVAPDHQFDRFWRRYEYLLLPITVMFIVLLVVAFGPLLLSLA